MNKPFIIAINAISGGGKTTIVNELSRTTPRSKSLFFDDRSYDSDSGINDICEWIEEGADVNKFNLDLLAEDIEILINENLDYIIMDYPFGYRHKAISEYIDYSIFIDTPLDIALARRIIRDYNNESILTVFDDMKQYLSKGRNAYLFGLNEIKENADLVIDGNSTIEDVISIITEKITQVKLV